MNRGMKALGTLGSGNHFLELQTVQSIEDSNPHNLFEGQVVCMIHSEAGALVTNVPTTFVALKISIEIDKVLGTTMIGDLKFKTATCCSPNP